MLKNILFFASLLLFILPSRAFAQIDERLAGELLENFFQANESATESDAQLYLELLEQLNSNPVDLNTATSESLLATGLVNELQIQNLINHRETHGLLLNAYELQSVPGWELEDIRRVMPFVVVGQGIDTRTTQIARGLSEGNNEVVMRLGRPMRPNFPSEVEGKPYTYAIRYRRTFDGNRLRFGFTAENDPGEAFFKGSNKQGFDFYSGHFFIQDLNANVKAFALGDYSARFGQGLLLQTGFAAGKSAETVNVSRGGRKLNAYAAFGEAFFFRGAATTVQLKNDIEITALYSRRRRDTNVVIALDTTSLEDPEIVFTSLQTSGLHRTASEIADEKAISEQVFGFNASWKKRQGHIGVNALQVRYERAWEPTPAPYRLYTFTGKSLTGLSVDYNYKRRNWFLFGETARSDNGGISTLNGLLFSADRHVNITAVHRNYSRNYQSVYAMPFGETNGAANENGLYLGADIRWTRRVQINLYADTWRHPWLRFGVDAPSQGHDYLARVLWTKSRAFSVYGLFQSKLKQLNSDIEGVNGLTDNVRHRFRLHSVYKVNKSVEMRSRVEWIVFREATMPRSHGFMIYQEAVVKPLASPLSGTVRFGIFDTDNFDTRIYTYENDLFSAVSIPGFSGLGTRWYANLKWRVNHWLRLEARVDQTNLLESVTSSNLDGRRTTWKLQARIKW